MAHNYKCDWCHAEIPVERVRFEESGWKEINVSTLAASGVVGAAEHRKLHACKNCITKLLPKYDV
jgi:hypothetical protein